MGLVMALELHKIHVYARHRDSLTGEVSQRLVDYNPALRLKSGDDPPIYLQRGVAYSAGGDEIHDLPDWFEDELAKCSDTALQAVGWVAGPEPTALPDHPLWPEPASGDPKEALLRRLMAMSTDELEAALSLIEEEHQEGTPATAIADIDPEDYPADTDDDTPPHDLLPKIPGADAPLWTCDECGEQMTTRQKGSHIAAHKRRAQRAQGE